jgi:molybdopterin synthase catalytic subunit
MTRKINVLFFATLKERAGTNRIEMDIKDGENVAGLKQDLSVRFPSIKPHLNTVVVSINQEFAFDDDVIPENAEVALFPPVSGGSETKTYLRVVTEPLDIDEMVKMITDESIGAVCVFTGIVRGVTRRGASHETSRLEYEAYVPMAEQKMAQVAQEIRQRWPAIVGIVIVQRIGLLDPQTPTVVIACSAAHRDTGVFEAARYGIDRLKEIVPIWKKEISPDGSTWVEGDYLPQKGD